MYQRVLVPLDGSELAESILGFMLQIAGPLDLEVTLVRVVFSSEDSVLAAARSYLHGVAEQLGAKGVRVRTEVRTGDPAEEILAGARDAGADIIAMTTRGQGAIARLLLGSVAEAVLRRADVPVFLLRHLERAATGAPQETR